MFHYLHQTVKIQVPEKTNKQTKRIPTVKLDLLSTFCQHELIEGKIWSFQLL